jgi:ribonuclease BN (tRNA processing enzyme)
MKITFLGTCSGTEPIAGYRHTSFAIEHAGGVYWFDAGEGCSYQGHLAGLDLLSVRAVFISHTHMDHVGGLANLLWNMRKISSRTVDPARKLTGKNIHVYFPDPEIWQGFRTVLSGSESGFKLDYTLDVCHYEDGLIHQDEHGVRVTALHNLHLMQPLPGERWKSFSFRIEVGGRTVVFSGDVKHVGELEPLLGGADLLLMETGHHKVEAICQYLRDDSVFAGQLGFVHHGRAMLADPAGELAKAKAIWGDRVFVAYDGLVMQA